jgi:hypothetical protein
MGPGRTICPLLEMRVCMVRISYRARALGHKTRVESPAPKRGADVSQRFFVQHQGGVIIRLSMVTRSGLRTWGARGETALRAPTRKPVGGVR